MENASCKNVSVQFWESTLRDSLKGLRSRYLSLLLLPLGHGTKKEVHFFVTFLLRNKKVKKRNYKETCFFKKFFLLAFF